MKTNTYNRACIIILWSAFTCLSACNKKELPQPIPPTPLPPLGYEVKAINIDTGYIGSMIIITGSNFGTDTSKVKVLFAAKQATIYTAKEDTITAKLPSDIVLGQDTIKVFIAGKQCVKHAIPFTVIDTPKLENTTIDKPTGFVGDYVVLTTTKLGTINLNKIKVKFGTVDAIKLEIMGEKLYVLAPRQAAGTVKVSVSIDDFSSNKIDFTYNALPTMPVEITKTFTGNTNHLLACNGNVYAMSVSDNDGRYKNYILKRGQTNWSDVIDTSVSIDGGKIGNQFFIASKNTVAVLDVEDNTIKNYITSADNALLNSRFFGICTDNKEYIYLPAFDGKKIIKISSTNKNDVQSLPNFSFTSKQFPISSTIVGEDLFIMYRDETTVPNQYKIAKYNLTNQTGNLIFFTSSSVILSIKAYNNSICIFYVGGKLNRLDHNTAMETTLLTASTFCYNSMYIDELTGIVYYVGSSDKKLYKFYLPV